MSISERTQKWHQFITQRTTNVLVAEDRDGLLGWVSYGPSRDMDGQGVHEIQAIYVQQQSWRKGVGRSLVDAAETQLCSVRIADISLWVFEQNQPSIAFYSRVGYHADGTVKEAIIGGRALAELRLRKPKVLLEQQVVAVDATSPAGQQCGHKCAGGGEARPVRNKYRQLNGPRAQRRER